jgi:GWxTD domain-containing protein
MFKGIRFVFFLFVSGTVLGQSLRDINYNYLYSPDDVAPVNILAVRNSSDWTIYFEVAIGDSATRAGYVIEWGMRQSLGDKENAPAGFVTFPEKRDLQGSFTVPISSSTVYVVAKLINVPQKRAWIFYETLDPAWPVNALIRKNNKVLFNSFSTVSDSIQLSGIPNAVVSYYNDVFPVSQPPFSEAQAKVSRGMTSDSTFFIRDNVKYMFSKKGLYLIQADTNSTQGIALRVEEDYPKYSRISSLAPPFVYITTAQEYNRMIQAKNDKKVFDRTVLGITNDQERAKRLMRNYFRRIELANVLFTSYKEGWKTDRGMAFIVFGLPDEVFKFGDREIWNYRLTSQDISFTFIKSSSVFDPDNYVLLRDKKYQQAWYETIDLWRGSRF